MSQQFKLSMLVVAALTCNSLSAMDVCFLEWTGVHVSDGSNSGRVSVAGSRYLHRQGDRVAVFTGNKKPTLLTVHSDTGFHGNTSRKIIFEPQEASRGILWDSQMVLTIPANSGAHRAMSAIIETNAKVKKLKQSLHAGKRSARQSRMWSGVKSHLRSALLEQHAQATTRRSCTTEGQLLAAVVAAGSVRARESLPLLNTTAGKVANLLAVAALVPAVMRSVPKIFLEQRIRLLSEEDEQKALEEDKQKAAVFIGALVATHGALAYTAASLLV